MGYHKKEIDKGVLGEFSKVKEEFQELEDAFEQEDSILILCELSDMIGAIEEYIKRWNMDINTLKGFSDKTKQSFKDGKR